jgi:predicted NUDIX family phosphoesterase
MGKMDEIIIVVPRTKLFQDESLAFQGVEQTQLRVMLLGKNIADNYTTMRRGDAEENTSFKQPIPYCVIRRGNEVFVYKRLSGGGETRLHDKLSIGAGGHMNTVEDAQSFDEVLNVNLSRELEEELAITTKDKKFSYVGFINDDINEVGKVHIGLLVILDIDADGEVEVREKEQLEGEWVTVKELLLPDVYERLESWSQIAADVLKG